jgi:hypothetical protein
MKLKYLNKEKRIDEAKVAVIDNARDHLKVDKLLKLDGKTPLYILRDSDVDGMIVSDKPITNDVYFDVLDDLGISTSHIKR